MQELNRLKQNIVNFINFNNITKDDVCKKVNIKEIEYDTLLENPIQDRNILFTFLNAFKLSFVDFITIDYGIQKSYSFRKSLDYGVDETIVQNFQNIASMFRQKELFENIEKEFENHSIKLDDELIEFLYQNTKLDELIANLKKDDKKPFELGKYIKEYCENLYQLFGIKLFFYKSKNTKLKGIYLNRPLAVSFINTQLNNYANILFTIFHELYHFLQDDGSLKDKFDIWGNETSEDVKANRFAIRLLMYRASKDELSNINDTNFMNLMKNYHISKQALEIYTNKSFSIKVGNMHYCHLNSSTKEINEILKKHLDKHLISFSIYNQLKEFYKSI